MSIEEAEADVAVVEAKANAELRHLGELWREIEARLKRVRTMHEEAKGVGAQVAPEVVARLDAIEVPRLDADQVTERAMSLREQAVAARREAVRMLKVEMQQHHAELTKAQAELSAEEQAAEKQLGAARAMALQVAQAAKQLAGSPPGLMPAKVRARREQPRVRMQVKIDFGSENNFYSGFSTNLSDGGVFIATVKHTPIGTPMDLFFRLPSGVSVEAQGVVRWVREVDDRQPDVLPGMGVQFLNLNDEAKKAIADFVQSREPMFYPEE